MGAVEKGFLQQAMSTPLGIALESSEPERDFMRLSQERTKNGLFKSLTIRRGGAARPNEIWIVRLRAEEDLLRRGGKPPAKPQSDESFERPFAEGAAEGEGDDFEN